MNFVWNYLNELSARSIRERGVFLSAYDIQKYADGCARELGLHSHIVQEIGKEYVSRRSLGWVPFKTGAARWKQGQVYHNGHSFKVWDSYGLAGYKFRSASFNE